MANEVSIKLPAEVVDRVLALAKEQSCTVATLIQESLHRYEAFGHLVSGIKSDAERSDALDALLEDYVDRMIHEARAERRSETREKLEGERKAS